MSKIELFPEKNIIGIFKGVSESGTEFAADLIISYTGEGIGQPQMGNFLLVELSSSEEASLGRITKLLSYGRLSSPEGEEYIVRMRERGGEVPKDIKERMMRYRVQIKMLGVLRVNDGIKFTPSQRRLPRLGARVAWPLPEVREELCKLGGGKTEIGHFVLGEFVYDGKKDASDEDVHLSPALPVTFNIDNLVAKRTAVFARAGYGKSNLMKYLISELYKEQPEIEDKEIENKRPVGMLIFDADGEYFWPDSKGRPGLCDVPHLCDKIAVFSPRSDARKPDYKNWLAGGVKMNIKELKPRDLFSIALTPDRQEQQNVIKLKAVKRDKWPKLVNLVTKEGMSTDKSEFGELLGYSQNQINGASVEINAAISNANHVVNMLHDPESKFLGSVMEKLLQGDIVIVDLSLLSAKAGEIIAGLLLRKIFSHNQENFLSDNQNAIDSNKPIPVIVVIEEAQRTLGGRLDETSPFVEWVKEGRKYDLGAVMVTQQPGAVASELLSQVDNWFCFHVLSEGDAGILGKYNSHFSTDVRSHMIAEPIVGNCFMWSAPKQPFVLPVRVHKFETYCEKLNVNGKLRVPTVSMTERMANDEKTRELQIKEDFCKVIREEEYLGLREFSGELRGIKSGKLYHLIKKLPLSVSAKINDYKLPLMKELFGEITVLRDNGEIVEITSGGDSSDYYYCAPKEKWGKILNDK